MVGCGVKDEDGSGVSGGGNMGSSRFLVTENVVIRIQTFLQFWGLALNCEISASNFVSIPPILQFSAICQLRVDWTCHHLLFQNLIIESDLSNPIKGYSVLLKCQSLVWVPVSRQYTNPPKLGI